MDCRQSIEQPFNWSSSFSHFLIDFSQALDFSESDQTGVNIQKFDGTHKIYLSNFSLPLCIYGNDGDNDDETDNNDCWSPSGKCSQRVHCNPNNYNSA